jgi:hypothetical protein
MLRSVCDHSLLLLCMAASLKMACCGVPAAAGSRTGAWADPRPHGAQTCLGCRAPAGCCCKCIMMPPPRAVGLRRHPVCGPVTACTVAPGAALFWHRRRGGQLRARGRRAAPAPRPPACQHRLHREHTNQAITAQLGVRPCHLFVQREPMETLRGARVPSLAGSRSLNGPTMMRLRPLPAASQAGRRAVDRTPNATGDRRARNLRVLLLVCWPLWPGRGDPGAPRAFFASFLRHRPARARRDAEA